MRLTSTNKTRTHKKIPLPNRRGKFFLSGGEVDAFVDSFLRDSFIIAPNLRGIFDFDDVYCNALHGNALDFYKQNDNA